MIASDHVSCTGAATRLFHSNQDKEVQFVMMCVITNCMFLLFMKLDWQTPLAASSSSPTAPSSPTNHHFCPVCFLSFAFLL